MRLQSEVLADEAPHPTVTLRMMSKTGAYEESNTGWGLMVIGLLTVGEMTGRSFGSGFHPPLAAAIPMIGMGIIFCSFVGDFFRPMESFDLAK